MTTNELTYIIHDELQASTTGEYIYKINYDNNVVDVRFYDGQMFEIEVRKLPLTMPAINPTTNKEIVE